MKLIDRLLAQKARFIDLQEVNEEDVLCYLVAKSKNENLQKYNTERYTYSWI